LVAELLSTKTNNLWFEATTRSQLLSWRLLGGYFCAFPPHLCYTFPLPHFMQKKLNDLPLIKILFAVFSLVAALIIISAIYFLTLFQPVNSSISEDISFAIPKGQSIAKISTRLKEKGLIKSTLAFKILVKKNSLETKIQAGSFTLNPNMSLSKVTNTLTTGTQDAWVTLQEGWRKEEIAESMVRQEFEYFDKTEFLELAKNSEGKLFPDTYLVPKQISATGFYNLLTNTFDRKIATLEKEVQNSDKTLDEILIMASLVEREGKGYENLRLVAGILWNRIDIGMALQADATLQYAKGFNQIQNTWWAEPRAMDKEQKSAYNTYLNPGLPPTPISNPGLDAIKATLNPTPSSFLYYIHDNTGKGHYSATYEGHLDNINKHLR